MVRLMNRLHRWYLPLRDEEEEGEKAAVMFGGGELHATIIHTRGCLVGYNRPMGR